MNLSNNSINIVGAARRNRTRTFNLQLTSMIDMFTILLVFLLKSFSTEGQIMTVTRDLRLPVSSSRQAPRVLSVISVTQEWILIDGRPISKLDGISAQSPLVIAPLKDELSRLRALSEGLGGMSVGLQGFSGSIAVQGDRDIPFEVLKRIMLTAGQVGYSNLHLAVLEKEE